MIVCFIGIVILSFTRASGGPVEVSNLHFYFGFFSIIVVTFIFSTVAVIGRKMKSVHFSIL